MNTDIDRDRGVLTPADRAYLLGEREMGHEQSKRNAEARIRSRIIEAARDFDLLLHTLPEKDRELLFERTTTDESFRDGLRAQIAFTYLGLERYGVDFEDVLVPAIRSSEEFLAARDLGASVSVDVTFDVTTDVETSIDGVTERLAADEPVTPRELFSVIMQGEYDATQHDRIALVRADDHQVDDEFLERLATYLEARIRRESDSRAVIHWDDE